MILKPILRGLSLAVCLATALPAPRSHAAQLSRITYYVSTGSPTASGEFPYPGSAACGWAIPMFSTVAIYTDYGVVTVRCNDTGLLAAWQVDVYSDVWPGWLDRDYFDVEVW